MKIIIEGKAEEEVIYLKKLAKFETNQEVVSDAFRVYKFLLEKANKGDIILIKSKETGKYKEVLLITRGYKNEWNKN